MTLKIRLEGNDDECKRYIDELKNNTNITILNISHCIEIEFKDSTATNTGDNPPDKQDYNPDAAIEHFLKEKQTPTYKEFEKEVQIDNKDYLLDKAKRILNGKPDKNFGYKKRRTND